MHGEEYFLGIIFFWSLIKPSLLSLGYPMVTKFDLLRLTLLLFIWFVLPVAFLCLTEPSGVEPENSSLTVSKVRVWGTSQCIGRAAGEPGLWLQKPFVTLSRHTGCCGKTTAAVWGLFIALCSQ